VSAEQDPVVVEESESGAAVRRLLCDSEDHRFAAAESPG
jgi:hypothetical protein